MHYEENGRLIPASPLIELQKKGAAASKANHKVFFSPNINDWNGAVKLTTADKKHFKSRVLGLSYWDSSTGRSVLIAELKNAGGLLSEDKTEVIYADAFTSLKADIRYRNSKSVFEQDVILRERPPSPAEWGLNPATTRLEVMTEFFDPPVPVSILSEHGDRKLHSVLDFGAMQIGTGRAFSLQAEVGIRRGVRVLKTWEKIDNRTFLIEAIEYRDVEGSLRELPPAEQSSTTKSPSGIRRTASKGRFVPEKETASSGESEPIRIASLPESRGFVLDYVFLTSVTDFRFKANNTYVITNSVVLSGDTIIEGNTVLKFSTNGGISFEGATVTCLTGPYRPAIFTGIDDDTAGQWIFTSNHDPGSRRYAMINIASGGPYNFENVHFRYADTAIWSDGSYTDNYYRNLQFIHCNNAFGGNGNTNFLRNVLAYDTDTLFTGQSGDPIRIEVEHLTVNGCNRLSRDLSLGGYCTLAITNSLLVALTNWGEFTITTNCVETPPSATGVFQTAGAGAHYLADTNSYRNSGTTNISSELRLSLRNKTTYPPTVFAATVYTNNRSFRKLVLRDDDSSPDLGYHYDPLDYILGDAVIRNATLTASNGVSIGFFAVNESWGAVTLGNGGYFKSFGTPDKLNNLVWYNTVQEQANTNFTKGEFIQDTFGIGEYETPSQVEFHFSRFSRLADGWYHLGRGDINWMWGPTVQNCEIYSGAISAVATGFGVGWGDFIALIDGNLFHRSLLEVYAFDNEFGATVNQNTFYGSSLDLWNDAGGNFWLEVHNNLFDQATILQNGVASTHDHNVYWDCSTNLYPIGTGDLFLTNAIAYETGTLGDWYIPTNCPIRNAGSTTANLLGLYHFTTTTNQVKETNSVVDIGFHYAATDLDGLPLDNDSDGTPDYLEDSNGNGVVNSGETDPNSATDLGLQIIITEPKPGLNLP